MNIVVIGGTGLIGSKVVARLREHGHQAIAATPSTGVNAVTGEGLDTVMTGADVVVDVANSPSFEDHAVLEFFESSSRHLIAAEKKAGVRHHVALSVVGTGRPALTSSGYIRAKAAQEALIRDSGIPFTIVRSTQFFDFLGAIAEEGSAGDELHLSTGLMQPIASADVSHAVSNYARTAPHNDVIEIAGPDQAPLAQWVQRFLAIIGDPRRIVADAEATYFGARLQQDTLLPGGPAQLGTLDFHAWLSQSSFAALPGVTERAKADLESYPHH